MSEAGRNPWLVVVLFVCASEMMVLRAIGDEKHWQS